MRLSIHIIYDHAYNSRFRCTNNVTTYNMIIRGKTTLQDILNFDKSKDNYELINVSSKEENIIKKEES